MGIKFGGWAPNRHSKNIGRFKFGGSVQDRHTYICKYEILADFNLAVAKQTAKPPNLIPRQIFWLYGILYIYIELHGLYLVVNSEGLYSTFECRKSITV